MDDTEIEQFAFKLILKRGFFKAQPQASKRRVSTQTHPRWLLTKRAITLSKVNPEAVPAVVRDGGKTGTIDLCILHCQGFVSLPNVIVVSAPNRR